MADCQKENVPGRDTFNELTRALADGAPMDIPTIHALVADLSTALQELSDSVDVVVIQNQLDALEDLLRASGLAKSIEDVRPINEARMKARHKHGGLLRRCNAATLVRKKIRGAAPLNYLSRNMSMTYCK